jgi:predicted HTH transcriptional regulator
MAIGVLQTKRWMQPMEVARQIYREDVEGGHITVFREMVAASLAHRELGPELICTIRAVARFC